VGREREGGSGAGGAMWRGRRPSWVQQGARRREGPGVGSPRERWGRVAVWRRGRQGSGGERALTSGAP
jgi:hypothetical protein